MTPMFKILRCGPYSELQHTPSLKKAVLNRDSRLSIEGRDYHIEIEPYSVTFIRESVAVRISTESSAADLLLIEFERLSDKYCSYCEIFDNTIHRYCALSSCRMNSQLRTFLETLMCSENYFGNPGFCKEKFSELMLILAWRTEPDDLNTLLGPVRDYDFKQKVKDIIRADPGIKTPEIADYMHMTIPRFRQTFKDNFEGLTFNEWKQGQRMGGVLTGIKDDDKAYNRADKATAVHAEYTCSQYLGLKTTEIRTAVQSLTRLNDEAFSYITQKLVKRS